MASLLRGSGVDALWPEAVTLLFMRVTIVTVAALSLRKRLD